MRVVVLQGSTVLDPATGLPVQLSPEPSAVTIGSFDGLHVGHRKIIGSMTGHARELGLRSVVVTFEPHPRIVLEGGGGCAVRLLTTFDEKVRQFASMPIDLLFVVRFDRQFASTSSEAFIREVLVKRLGARHVTVGYDHGFGKRRSGSEETLHELGAACGFSVDVVGEVVVAGSPVSSTRIRRLLESAKIREADECLGAPYSISGTVIEGDRLGRSIGFPTANIALSDSCKMLPAHGVYAATVEIDGKEYPVMMNIGHRPTVAENGEVRVEAHIIGFSGNLYGRFLSLKMLDFIRAEKRFASLDELRAQLDLDKKEAEFCKK
ncbi:bifunctional riboflavin kinase/FAD synthetase [Chlorobaculum sp. 24CR]|uniref:bifunctional riboflavin kinase/FAD synthetase n=1 Tax=Chlorobaculum sp. 24CR TaxID=2508878 RepID=UPI00100A23F9|nr:bifunctional riboflavin kinase/FAD synthetase [Chlorobaculum sp. 24CR]RXK88700.1 bifunctional riboflavin kinase/FAD synthetase [Chlorobaculum sp. 24CR]